MSETLEQQCEPLILASGQDGLTPDEAADKLGLPRKATRTPFTRLKNRGRIAPDWKRRRKIEGGSLQRVMIHKESI